MKPILTLLLVFAHLVSTAQNKIDRTDEFQIEGLVQNSKKITVSDLLKLKSIKMENIVVTNHLGVKKGTASGLSGIPIKEIFKDVNFKEENPKLLSEYYFIFIASDGYKVVYSWNEIFNTSTGDHTFVIVEKENKVLSNMEDRILVATTTDFKTGRRFIKGLTTILVQRVVQFP